MAQTIQTKCDACGKVSVSTEGWFVLLIEGGGVFVAQQPATEHLSNSELYDACGEECCCKLLWRLLSTIKEMLDDYNL